MPGKVFDVLNEVVVDRGSNPYLSKIECYEHNHLITKVTICSKSYKVDVYLCLFPLVTVHHCRLSIFLSENFSALHLKIVMFQHCVMPDKI